MQLIVEKIAKLYGERIVFSNLSFTLESGKIVILAGKNGSGKSTLLKILAGITRPTVGDLSYQDDNGQKFIPQNKQIGFCSPYLNLYLHFSLEENIRFFNKLRGTEYQPDWLERSGLKDRSYDLLKNYSSGMLQRAKLLFAVTHSPEILFLDEPGSNLDDSGREFVAEIVKRQKERNGMIIIATNDNVEMEMGDQIVRLD